MGILVINPGFLSTIQDGGRTMYQQYGVPVSGVMDHYSYKIANMLVGNEIDESVMEITMMGPTLKFQTDTVIAITGGNLNPKVNGEDIKMWKSVLIKEDDVLSFAGLSSGCRSYISFKGGIKVPKVMGSRSTYLKAAIGGLNGKSLKKDDVLPIDNFDRTNYTKKELPEKYIPCYGNSYEVRVVMGPQSDYFTDKGISDFFSGEYAVTNECDRMGFRFEGDPVELKDGSDIISDGISFGAIQIPGHGKPIVMMADRQTTGGYAKIANVIFDDLSILSQSKPNDKVKFKKIDVYEAHAILKDTDKKFASIREELDNQEKIFIKSTKNYSINVNGKSYEVKVEELA
jgi:biotin-dependent carboxylase-like uncharacterized protein